MRAANFAVALLPTKAITATDTGAAVNVADFSGLGLLVLNASAGTGTTPTSAVKLQHSDDGSTGWADTGHAFAAQAAVASFQSLLVNTDSLKKFVRVVNTLGGTTPGYSYGVSLIGGKQYA